MADLSVNTQEGGPRVLDFVFGAALGVALSVGLMEVVKVAEFGQADLYGPGAYIKISDTVTASIGAPLTETFHVQEFGQVDLYGPGAWVKVQDTVTASLFNSIDVNKSESLKIADTVTAQIGLLSASGFDETIYLEDGGLGYEQLHVQDIVVQPAILVGPQITEQTVHVQDTVTASLDGFQTSAGPDALKLADSASAQLLLIQASASELLHLVDPVTVSRPAPRTLPLLYSSVTNRQVLWSSE